MLCADVLEGLGRFAPGQTSIRRVAQGARGLAEFPQHFRLEQPVLQTFGLEDANSQGSDALVERATLSLDARTAFQRLGNREMIAADPCLFERRCTCALGDVELADRYPNQREVEREHALHQRVMPGTRERQAALESLDRALIVPELR